MRVCDFCGGADPRIKIRVEDEKFLKDLKEYELCYDCRGVALKSLWDKSSEVEQERIKKRDAEWAERDEQSRREEYERMKQRFEKESK